jgi:hypothetical protein
MKLNFKTMLGACNGWTELSRNWYQKVFPTEKLLQVEACN